METTRLSSKGQVIIPKPLRTAHHWTAGQELVAIDVGDGVLLKPKSPFSEKHIDEVASSLKYSGTAKTLDELAAAIGKGVKSRNK
jgi:AbrB family looped-hinge helix DNA binding protein